MPRGVTDQFLQILHRERKATIRSIVALALLVPLAYFMAELTDQPLLGYAVLATLAALAGGLGLGLLWSRHETTRYNESLKNEWNAWMRMSLSATTIHEVARHAQGKHEHRTALGVAWGGLLVANAVLFLALWLDAPWAYAYGILVAVANGATIGTLAGHAAGTYRWVNQFHHALDELIADGQLGMWGEV